MDVREIEKALKKPGKSKSGLASAIGRSPSVVTNILSGEREIKARELPVIAAYLGIGENQLIRNPAERPSLDGDGELVDVAAIGDETIERTLRAAITSRRQAEVWRLDKDLIEGAGYSPGDYLVVDLMQRPRAGDVVLAMLREGKRETPIFRALYPPKLWCVTERQLPPGSSVLSVDNVNIIVRGVVVLRIR